MYTKDIEKSLHFYTAMGLKKSWMIERKLEDDYIWKLIGLKFQDQQSSELVLSNHPNVNVIPH